MRLTTRPIMVFLGGLALGCALIIAWRSVSTGFELISGYNEDVRITVEIGRFGPGDDEVVDRLFDDPLEGFSRLRFRRFVNPPGEVSYRVVIQSEHCSSETVFGYVDGLSLAAGSEYVILVSGFESSLQSIPSEACAVDGFRLH